MESKKKKNNRTKNLRKVNKSFKKMRQSITRMWRLLFTVLRIFLVLLTSPIQIFILFLILFVIWIFLSWDLKDKIWEFQTDSIIINKDEVKSIGFEVYEYWPNKWLLKGCEWLDLPSNIYTSKVPKYAERSFQAEAQTYNNFCFYHLLYIKQVSNYYTEDTQEKNDKLDQIKDELKNTDKYTEEQLGVLSIGRQDLKKSINLRKEILQRIIW